MNISLSKDSQRDCPCKRIPLHLSSFTAAEYGDVHALTRHQKSSVALQEDAAGNTPLHLAAQHGHIAATEMLLRAGCDVNASKSGATALHRAAYSGAVGTMQLLLNRADCNLLKPDTSFGDRMTPLHKAACAGRYLAVKLLLDNLRSRNLLEEALRAQDSLGRTPLQVARDQNANALEESQLAVRWNEVAGGAPNWYACIQLLEKATDDLTQRSSIKSSDTMNFSLSKLPDCNQCDQNGRCTTASWEAAFRNALSSSLERHLLLHDAENELSQRATFSSLENDDKLVSFNESSQQNYPVKGQSDASLSNYGTSCAQCGKNTVVLFLRGTRKVCSRCK